MAGIRAHRARHGRSVRGSLLKNSSTGSPLSFFETVVSQTVEFLRNAWPDELSKLDYRVVDAPIGISPDSDVPRYTANSKTFRITLYRIPIERMTHHRRTDRLDERFHIEQFVFQAAAELIGRGPEDLIPEQFRR